MSSSGSPAYGTSDLSEVSSFTNSALVNSVNNSTLHNYSLEPTCYGDGSYHVDFTQIRAVALTFVVAYTTIIILAISGNALVIWTVWRNKHMHTVTNYYIVNLAICDFLVSALVMPLKLLEYAGPCEWDIFHSDILCSFQYYLLPIFVFASVLTLVAISIERYYAIVHPFSAMKIHSTSRTRKILAATWIIPIVLASPYVYCRSFPVIIVSEYGKISRQICNDKFDDIDLAIFGEESGRFRRGYFIFLFVCIYLIPMTVIVTTCGRIVVSLLSPIEVKGLSANRTEQAIRHEENKRKVARMVIVVSLAFILAWSPQYIVSIISQLQTESFLREGNFFFTMLLTHLFGFTNSCINPFIYTVMSLKFRTCFKAVFRSITDCCRPTTIGANSIYFARKFSERFNNGSILRTNAKHSFYGSATNISNVDGEIVINLLVMRNGVSDLATKSDEADDSPVDLVLANSSVRLNNPTNHNINRRTPTSKYEAYKDCSVNLLSGQCD